MIERITGVRNRSGETIATSSVKPKPTSLKDLSYNDVEFRSEKFDLFVKNVEPIKFRVTLVFSLLISL